jgi:hypothetical protein
MLGQIVRVVPARSVLIVALAFALGAIAPAWCADEKYKDAVNELTAEHVECSAFYNVLSACSVNDDAALSTMERQWSTKMSDRAFALTTEAGMKAHTVVARFQLYRDSMLAEIDKNCRNISILIAKHGNSCQTLAEDPLNRGTDLFKEQLRQ